MRCPNCQAEMEPGEVKLVPSWGGWLYAFGGSAVLRFQGAQTSAVTVLDRWRVSRAFRCGKCGTLVMATKPS